jgi:tyrosine-protein kinase Etk/Wzc
LLYLCGQKTCWAISQRKLQTDQGKKLKTKTISIHEERCVPIHELESASRITSVGGPSVLVWLRASIKWKRLVWGTALAILAGSLLAVLLLPNRYTATVVIMPPQVGGASSSAGMMAQLSGVGALASSGGGLNIKNPNDQQVALLKSRTVEDAMVARFRLRDIYHSKYSSSARKSWERHTATDNGLKDGLIHLSVTDTDALRAAEMANAWVEEYRHFSATLAISEASQRRLFYERELSIAHDDLARAEEDMKQTQERTGLIDAEGQDRTLIASAAVLRGQLAAKQVEIRAMREFAADQNPDLRRAEQELGGIEGQLVAMDASSNRKTGDLIAVKGTVTQASLDFARALREVKYRETIQDLLTRQYEGARVDEARQGPLVQIVDPAVVPDRPVYIVKIWIALGALICCLPLGVLAARGAEVLADLLRARRGIGSWSEALEQLWGDEMKADARVGGQMRPVPFGAD